MSDLFCAFLPPCDGTDKDTDRRALKGRDEVGMQLLGAAIKTRCLLFVSVGIGVCDCGHKRVLL